VDRIVGCCFMSNWGNVNTVDETSDCHLSGFFMALCNRCSVDGF
jgi:hypothetical protein